MYGMGHKKFTFLLIENAILPLHEHAMCVNGTVCLNGKLNGVN